MIVYARVGKEERNQSVTSSREWMFRFYEKLQPGLIFNTSVRFGRDIPVPIRKNMKGCDIVV